MTPTPIQQTFGVTGTNPFSQNVTCMKVTTIFGHQMSNMFHSCDRKLFSKMKGLEEAMLLTVDPASLLWKEVGNQVSGKMSFAFVWKPNTVINQS